MQQPDISIGPPGRIRLKHVTTSREYYVSLPARRETLNQPLFVREDLAANFAFVTTTSCPSMLTKTQKPIEVQ
jgi:hypothetical protein